MEKVKLTVPILVDWESIENYMAQHDVVKVVRCRDCRYWGLTNFIGEPAGWCGRQEKSRNPDWYCADGERRERE